MTGNQKKYVYLPDVYSKHRLSLCVQELSKLCSAIPAALVLLIISWSYYVVTFVVIQDLITSTFLLCCAFTLSLLSAVFALALLILLLFHTYLIFKNKSTLEYFRPPNFRGNSHRIYGFNLGWKNNFLQIFGSDVKHWLLPVFSR
uniref:Palmitoyltransferase ZDHHC2 n=1 Tax=Schistosoma haematobium TaxID=6185 RepID=A0A094ZDG8_SCHHA